MFEQATVTDAPVPSVTVPESVRVPSAMLPLVAVPEVVKEYAPVRRTDNSSARATTVYVAVADPGLPARSVIAQVAVCGPMAPAGGGVTVSVGLPTRLPAATRLSLAVHPAPGTEPTV